MLMLADWHVTLEKADSEKIVRRQTSCGIVFACSPSSARWQTNLMKEWEHSLTDDAPASPRRIERAPPQSALAAAQAGVLLAALLADPERFRDSASVGRALSGNLDHANPKMVATHARQGQQIFGVWDGNAYRYPVFQFDALGQPRTDVQSLIAVLPRDADGSGRDAALWLFAPDAALGGRSPADVFPEDPESVIALGRTRRDGGDAVD